MKCKTKKKVSAKTLNAPKRNKRSKTIRNAGETKVEAKSSFKEEGGGGRSDIFNRNKLSKILKGLAVDPSLAPATSEEHVASGSASIFNVERLKKISKGLKQVKEDEEECCIVYSGPVTVATSKRREKTANRRTTIEGEATKKSTQVPSKNIFDKTKLEKILNGLRSSSVSSLPRTEPVKRVHAAVDPSEDKAIRPKKEKKMKDQNVPPLSTTLRHIMVERLNAARFRYINETLYTSSGVDAESFFREDPEAFNVYHSGYRTQVSKWPTNPIDIIIEDINKLSGVKLIADFGCGDAKLAKSVRNKVYSFDLVALNECVIACNMSKVPLAERSVDVAVFCLSLMGTNLSEYIAEANRVLKIGGILKIAEVESRFDNVRKFVQKLENLGFSLLKKNTSHKMFLMMDFKKTECCKRNKLPTITLKPCIYKKR